MDFDLTFSLLLIMQLLLLSLEYCHCLLAFILHFPCNNAVVVAIAGILSLLAGISWLYKLARKRKHRELKRKFFKRNGGLLLQQQLSSNHGSVQKTKIFTSKELERATDRFNENRILGQGGQGTVYKGMLEDGRIVAVKRGLSRKHRPTMKEVSAELERIGLLQRKSNVQQKEEETSQNAMVERLCNWDAVPISATCDFDNARSVQSTDAEPLITYNTL